MEGHLPRRHGNRAGGTLDVADEERRVHVREELAHERELVVAEDVWALSALQEVLCLNHLTKVGQLSSWPETREEQETNK